MYQYISIYLYVSISICVCVWWGGGVYLKGI